MKKQRENKGITLIALVITIIILLILAGISISSLTNNGLFGKAQDADKQTEIAQIKEDIQLDIQAKQTEDLGPISNEEVLGILETHGTVNYEDDGKTIKGITTEKGYEIPIAEIYTEKITIQPKTLASVVNVGDYVQYTPDTVTTEAHNALITELGTYSGNTDTSYNTATTTKQDTLNWRVLDIVKDENGNDCVRLISEMPTTSTIRLYGAKGYNNAVYLLDKICNTFYNKAGYTRNVQNLKIEDIEKHLTYDYTSYEEKVNGYTKKYGKTLTYTAEVYRYYPNIFVKEKTGWVNGVQGTELGLSEQTSPINMGAIQAGTAGIKTTETGWSKSMVESDFTNSKYHNLFIKDNNGNNYSTYLLSSRSTTASPRDPYTILTAFCVRSVTTGKVAGSGLFLSYNSHIGSANALRPVVTLNSDILVDTTDATRDGTEAGKAYMIKK